MDNDQKSESTEQPSLLRRLVHIQDEQHVNRLTEYAAMALKEVDLKFQPGTRAYDKLRDAIDTLLS